MNIPEKIEYIIKRRNYVFCSNNGRIRFRRKIDKRANDQLQIGDPYRTSYGLGEGGLVMMILGIIAAVIGIVLLTIFLISGQL